MYETVMFIYCQKTKHEYIIFIPEKVKLIYCQLIDQGLQIKNKNKTEMITKQ